MNFNNRDSDRLLINFLRNHCSDFSNGLGFIFGALQKSSKLLAHTIRHASLNNFLGRMGYSNIHQESVEKLDEYANKIFVDDLCNSGYCFAVLSEEMEEVLFFKKSHKRKYIVAIDPLDGSSNLDVNGNVGTIFSVYEAVNYDESDFLQGFSKQLVAGYILYGPATLLVFAFKDGVFAFTLDYDLGEFVLACEYMKIADRGKILSFNFANINDWDLKIQNYVRNFIYDDFELNFVFRYSGAMVLDIHRILLQGGVFLYPKDLKNKNGKLRLLYEIGPMGFIIYRAGGKVLIDGRDFFDFSPDFIHQRASVVIGSSENVLALI